MIRFLMSFLRGPQIKAFFCDKRGTFIHIIFIVNVLAFLCCLGILFNLLAVQPVRANSGIAAARALYHGSAGDPTLNPSAQGISSNPTEQHAVEKLPYSKLHSVNPDVEGWVTIPDSNVDYPVLRTPAGSPDFYLTHDWMRNQSKYGSVFMLPSDLKAPKSSVVKNTIIYGHSMKDGTMFADLLKYDSLEYYRSHTMVQLQQGAEKSDWKIFAVIKANTDPAQGQPFDYQKRSFASTADFLKYIYEIQIRSVFNLPVDLKSTDSILTLSTCSYEFDGFRTVVFARKVRKNEKPGVETSKAEKNSRALYPDCWYKKYGGQKPSLPDFQSAAKK